MNKHYNAIIAIIVRFKIQSQNLNYFAIGAKIKFLILILHLCELLLHRRLHFYFSNRVLIIYANKSINFK